MTLHNYYAYFGYRNTSSSDLCLQVVKNSFIINSSTSDKSIENITTISCNTNIDQDLIFQIISDRMYSQFLNIFSGDIYEYYILLIKDSKDNTNFRNNISTYLYNSENIIEILKFKLDTKKIMNSYFYQKNKNDLTLYENDLSYLNLKDILIEFIPEELILIIYNMLNINTLNFNYFKSDNNNFYICNPSFEINSNLLYSKINNDIILDSGSHKNHRFLLKDDSSGIN
jgi:hypothetical protein